ncbi:hypothetical protein BO86DRAFT_390877 [Aspergillus japonicus CBS 114.51]|uniref:Uncharacterized protein n=1 Tax=Aspergillus japonicus CBS 114.51 TaxID=1448312 RepID=A0A8T8WUY9_ASPJA|nr:hypothetical protein BO86DRAFT_390877 [Aspergillus japonicus CBS 114.51]RAH79656.1 hypothetical protein BO86DRAFT_390877 [Aspergillus japonicus CBS 114.51]
MRFNLATASVLSLLAVATARVIRRDIPTIIQDLTQVNTDIGSLSAAVYSYSGGLPAALEIQTQEAAVERSLDQASADVNGTAVFTASESSRVTEALTQLEPVMRSSIAALVLKVSHICSCMHFSRSFTFHLSYIPIVADHDADQCIAESLHHRRRGKHHPDQPPCASGQDRWSVRGPAGQGGRSRQGDHPSGNR